MRLRALPAGLAVVALLGAVPAFAGWSSPQTLARPGYVTGGAEAVDSRGDAAVAWAATAHDSRSAGPPGRASVRLAVAVGGRVTTRTVWSSTHAVARDVSVVIGHGEATIAWRC